MGSLQKALEKELSKLPRIVAEKVVAEKLAADDIHDTEFVARIVDHLFNNPDGDFEWEDGPDLEFVFTAEDGERAAEIADDMMHAIPELIDKFPRKVAPEIVADLRKQWKTHEPIFQKDNIAFKSRLQVSWGQPLDDLRLLLEIARESGEQFHQSHLRSRRKRGRERNEVLGRLHMRACQITFEIIVLLGNGFGEGARARWRTLFEVTVIAALVVEGGDALATRYLDHEAIDQKKVMEDYNRSAPLLGEPALSTREVAAINKEFDAVVLRYGKAFRGMYGWASGQLGLGDDPKFYELQELAGSLSMKIYYRLACFGVHGSPKGLTQQLHRFNAGAQAAGACNIGLEEPGTNSAHALTRITTLLLQDEWNLDTITHARTLLQLRDDIDTGFHRAARTIERDEARNRRRLVRQAQKAAQTLPRTAPRRVSKRVK